MGSTSKTGHGYNQWASSDVPAMHDFNSDNAVSETIAQKVDSLTQQVANLGGQSPKGVYATAAALQTAYPFGTSGIFVVQADGNWYYWGGSDWLPGGPYTSTDASTVKTAAVSTTGGQSWSKTYQNVNTLTDGDGNQTLVAATPNFARKKIVVFGSSVATGWLATNANGWASMLASLLSGRGYNVVNRSIPGNATANLINRFYTDIVPEHPDVCIIALSLMNEGILGTNPEAIYNQYHDNIIRLIQMCRQQNIIPMVASCYPNTQYTSTQYQYVKQFNAALEDVDVAAFNLLGAVDDGTGKWIASCRGDDNHPNDIGHAEMFASIPPTFFDCIKDSGNLPLKSKSGGILLGADTTTQNPMQANIRDTVKSFTAAFWAKDFDGASIKIFFCVGAFESGSAVRIRQINGTVDLTIPGNTWVISSNAPIKTDRLYHHIAMTYNNATQTISLYVDGVFVGSNTYPITLLGGAVSLGGNNYTTSYNASNVGFQNFALYRTCLNADQVGDLYRGKILKQSLELFCPLDDPNPAQGAHLRNLAPTASYMVANTAALSPAPGTQNQLNLAGGVLYVDGGALKFRSANGTVTQIAAL